MTDCLLLNFSYEPLGVVSLRRAVRLLFCGKAELVHGTGNSWHSEKAAFPLPSVVRLLYYVMRKRKHVPLTKKNVLLRDQYRCGYCLQRSSASMSVDHVIPKSRGGTSEWMNLVACCTPCNSRKFDRSPAEAGMPLRVKLRVPQFIPWVVVRKHTMPGEWGKYLSLYGVAIEERAN
jgi:5-methylcytosine-specific restriction endonuclease McrA